VDQRIEDLVQSLDIPAQLVGRRWIDATVASEGGWIEIGDRALVQKKAATVRGRSFDTLVELIPAAPSGQFAPKAPEARFRPFPLLCG